MHGNPVEALVKKKHGDDYLKVPGGLVRGRAATIAVGRGHGYA